MTSIYFAASPIHLMCLNELKGGDDCRLILLLRRKNSFANEQMFKAIDFLGWSSYEILWIESNPIVRYLSERRFIHKLQREFGGKDLSFAILDFRNSFMQSLRTHFPESNFLLIDDDFYTYVAYIKYIKNGHYLAIDQYQGVRGRLSKLLYFGTHYNTVLKKKIELFTIYANDIGVGDDSRNKLQALKHRIEKEKPSSMKDVVFFIGTRLSERGAVSIEQELLVVERVNQFWANKGKKNALYC